MSPGKSERFEMRLDADLLDAVDQWRMDQGGGASRAEAIRRLTQVGLETHTARQTFVAMKFNILSAALVPATARRIEDAYAYAWDREIYPWFHEGAPWHTPFAHEFRVSEPMMRALMTWLDELWLKRAPTPTFYELEDRFGGRYRDGEWDRSGLIGACRYAFLSKRFDAALFDRLVAPGEHPVEAAGINEPYERNADIFLM
jgi:hypothetical protein